MSRFPTTAWIVLAVGLVGSQALPGTQAVAGESPLAPPFVVKNLDGKLIRSNDLKGHPVVLDFWATWCGPCRASMPHLDTVQDRYRDRGLVVLGLSVDEAPPASVKRFTQKLGVRFPIAMADERMLDQYGPIRSIPTTFFIHRDGRVVRRVVGYLDPETLESYVLELF